MTRHQPTRRPLFTLESLSLFLTGALSGLAVDCLRATLLVARIRFAYGFLIAFEKS